MNFTFDWPLTNRAPRAGVAYSDEEDAAIASFIRNPPPGAWGMSPSGVAFWREVLEANPKVFKRSANALAQRFRWRESRKRTGGFYEVDDEEDDNEDEDDKETDPNFNPTHQNNAAGAKTNKRSKREKKKSKDASEELLPLDNVVVVESRPGTPRDDDDEDVNAFLQYGRSHTDGKALRRELHEIEAAAAAVVRKINDGAAEFTRLVALMDDLKQQIREADAATE